MDKQNVEYIYNVILFKLKKRKEIKVYPTTQMNYEETIVTERSQS